MHREAAHAEDVAGLDDDVVEREGEGAVGKTYLKECAVLTPEVSRQNGADGGTDVIARVGREEAKLAAVDAEERDTFKRRRFGHAEEGAVTTDHAAGIAAAEAFARDRPTVDDGDRDASGLGGLLHGVHNGIHPGLGAVDDKG